MPVKGICVFEYMDINDLKNIKEQSFKYLDEPSSINAVCLDYKNLQYVKYQTNKVCKAAIDNNSAAYQLVGVKNYEISRHAVLADPFNLFFVPKQTKHICTAAVMTNPDMLQFINNQTEAICLCALRADVSALRYVKELTPNICKYLLESGKVIAKYINKYQLIDLLMDLSLPEEDRLYVHGVYEIKNNSEDIMNDLKIISENFWRVNKGGRKNDESIDKFTLLLAKEQTEDMCLHALGKYNFCYPLIKNRTSKIINRAFELGDVLEILVMCNTQDEKICVDSININSTNISLIRSPTNYMKMLAYENDPANLKYIHF